MGAQDSFGQAEDFHNDFGTNSVTMIWDQGFDSWSYYGVRGQPTAILVDASGEPITGWTGNFDQEEVLRLASES